jgi:hypothetical protein
MIRPLPAWLRYALVAVALLLIGVPLAMRQWYPAASAGKQAVADPRTAAILANGWSELVPLRMHLNMYTSENGEWPRDLAVLDVPLSGKVFDVTSSADYEIVATVRPNVRYAEALGGLRVVHRLNPKTLNWDCMPGSPPLPESYLPLNCHAPLPPPVDTTARWLTLIVLGGVAIVIGLGLLLVLRHPLIAPIQRDPSRLLRQPIGALARIDRALGLLRRRDDTLAAARVQPADWRDAIGYAALAAEQRAAMLALRVGARSERASGWPLPGDVFEWRFPLELPVTLERCLVWFPPDDLDGAQLVRPLRQVQTGLDVLLAFVPAAADAGALRTWCGDRSNLYVCIGVEAQTAWLLERDPVRVLLRQMAQQLKVTRISPYQTRGGVARPSSFFGREALLSRVILREPGNYLLVGGRQLGKTSLMKAIERRLREHPQLACVYVSLRDHRLLPRLAAQCELPADSGLDAIVAHLARAHGGKRLLLLIDEADPFFRHDAAHDYRELAALRAISEEGRCHFLLAGFWDLYAAAALDYQSPLRNFGEVITVGALEPDACRDLATVPLGLLNLRFADPSLVERLVEASGRRANLVAILCQECLEALERGETVIEAPHLDRALRSQATLDAIAGWGRLSQDEAASRLDRIVVYRVAANGETTLADIVALVEGAGAAADVEALRRAFARLSLAFVLARTDERYRFAVPLFRTQFEAAELPVFLAQELKRL